MNNESCPVDGWHVTVQFSPSQSLSAEAFFSSTWFPSCLSSLTLSIHKAYSEMLYFQEHVQWETLKLIRPNHRYIFLLLFNPYLRLGYLWCPSLNWGFLHLSAHPHPYICQQCLRGAQRGNTTAHAPATPPWTHCLGHTVEDSEQAAACYPTACKVKLQVPPSMPNRSQCFGAASGCCRLSAAQLSGDAYGMPVEAFLFGDGTPWPWQLILCHPLASDVSPATHHPSLC